LQHLYIADKRQEIEQFDKKLRTTKKEEEKDTLKKNKEEIDRERDALVKQALELDQEATQLNTKSDKQGKTVVDLQKIYDDVRANPERAKELAGKVR
jgi:predicted nuclease with TOPRIM domain